MIPKIAKKIVAMTSEIFLLVALLFTKSFSPSEYLNCQPLKVYHRIDHDIKHRLPYLEAETYLGPEE
jgi:hypothetical protein